MNITVVDMNNTGQSFASENCFLVTGANSPLQNQNCLHAIPLKREKLNIEYTVSIHTVINAHFINIFWKLAADCGPQCLSHKPFLNHSCQPCAGEIKTWCNSSRLFSGAEVTSGSYEGASTWEKPLCHQKELLPFNDIRLQHTTITH